MKKIRIIGALCVALFLFCSNAYARLWDSPELQSVVISNADFIGKWYDFGLGVYSVSEYKPFSMSGSEGSIKIRVVDLPDFYKEDMKEEFLLKLLVASVEDWGNLMPANEFDRNPETRNVAATMNLEKELVIVDTTWTSDIPGFINNKFVEAEQTGRKVFILRLLDNRTMMRCDLEFPIVETVGHEAEKQQAIINSFTL